MPMKPVTVTFPLTSIPLSVPVPAPSASVPPPPSTAPPKTQPASTIKVSPGALHLRASMKPEIVPKLVTVAPPFRRSTPIPD